MSYRTNTAEKFMLVTPNDNADLPGGVPAAINLSAAGTVVVTGSDGLDAAIPLQAGINGIAPRRIKATGTTAGLTIHALYLA